jgi:RNA polymerase sigma factor (sigma-70 family)
MTCGRLSQFVQHLRRAALLRDGAGLTDGQLLEDFLTRGDDGALEALVHRHAAMAWGVCRRILGNHHDAEDAFQATFLILVRRAASIVPREMVAGWLYGVAQRTALKARANSLRRKVRERQVRDMPEAEAVPEDAWSDFQPLLDEELSRLPDKYRVPVVLCDLEGKTRKQAARQLGWPEGTVAGRLARARKILAESLARRGVVLPAGATAVLLARNAAAATVPAGLVAATVKAARLFAAGIATVGTISARVVALAEGGLQTMLLTKQKTALVIVLATLIGLGGAIGWATGAAEESVLAQQAAPKKSARKQQDDNLKNTLLALDDHLWQAASRGDWRETQKFYAAEYLGVGSVYTSDKAANADAVKTHRPAEWHKRNASVVRVSKDTAVLTYIYSCKVLSPDGRLLQSRQNHRVSLVWAQRNGGWVLVYCHDEHGRPGVRVHTIGEILDVELQRTKVKANPGSGK